MESKEISIFIATLLYFAWNCQNKKLFSGSGCFTEDMSHFNSLVEEFLDTSNDSKDSPQNVLNIWQHPPEGWWKINIDAAFINGEAGLAFVVRD